MLARRAPPLILALLVVACGGTAQNDLDLLPRLVLQPDDVPSTYEPSRAEPISNDVFIQQLGDGYGMPGDIPDGRLDGYLSSFLDHPAYITNRVDLFSTESQAAAFLDAPYEASHGISFQVSALGDEARGDPVNIGGCPCVVRFRQNATVAQVYFEGPGGTGEIEDTLNLARKVEQHIAEALRQ